MKKTFTLLLIILSSTLFSNLQAQQKLEVGVSSVPLIDFNQGYFGLTVVPSFRYYITPRLAISNNFFFQFQNDIQVEFEFSNFNVRSFGFVPSLRYLLTENEKLNFFAEGGFGFGFSKYSQVPPDGSSIGPFPALRTFSEELLILNVGVGLDYKIGERTALELSIPYIDADNVDGSSSGSIYSGVGFLAGFKYRIR
ncbi:MAG: hypothetical protein AAFX87_26045 [Bacteroidota bacterium]